MTPPRSAFGAPPQGGAASGPAKPVPRRPLGSIGVVPRGTRSGPFDLDDERVYRDWREVKLADVPLGLDTLVVDVRDPFALGEGERRALRERCARFNMAIYRTAPGTADPALPRALGLQLGLERLDANWLADEDGISPITVRAGAGPAGAYIPYTDRAIQWHTDGYYHPAERRIRGMILHCVRPAAQGGANRLLDHELAYIALRDLDPAHVQALAATDAMSIPERTDDDGVARPEQTGPVFSTDADGRLHMRYTARTRSIAWKADAATQAAVAALRGVLATSPFVLALRLEAGMGLVCNNVLHDRAAFADDPQRPRLLYRARYLDRVDRG
ncbi:TauD/TfdA family dioxygenase [Piscinibacter sp.]|uniref:TauD/TfdA family dioxygenase n=1 Tax=Piscinibacter sp. TaxID=1903157 RepID=UPI00258559A6|nr:TauD/TfdA family dioxygenase [Piscinibacter sp.]